MTNPYDLACLAILAFFTFSGWVAGLARSLFGIVASGVSMCATYALAPPVSRLARQLGAYGALKGAIAQMISPYLERAADGAIRRVQSEIIGSLPQPPFILNQLVANNNPEAYAALDVSSLSGYIAGYFANMAINLIVSAVLYFMARALLSYILNMLNIFNKIPAIRAANHVGGALAGLARGLIVVWVALCLLGFFFLSKNGAEVFARVDSGGLAAILYNNNPIMAFISGLMPK